MKKVSIIVPVYNAARLIGATIESVKDQTWQNWELILVNDGSTDNTASVIKPFLSDTRIKYIHQHNAGCSAAKNTGLAAVTGDYIQYLDADDILSKDKIEEQVMALANDPFAIAVCRTKVFSDNIAEPFNEEIDTHLLYSTDQPIEFLLNLYGLNGRQGMIQPNAFLISKKLSDAMGNWDTSISPAPDEDGEYFCRALLKASSIIYTEKGINYYRKLNGSGSLSKQVSFRHAKGGLLSLRLKRDHLLAKENSKRVKHLMAKHFADFIYQYSMQYPSLCEEAAQDIYNMGISRIPAVGGRYFKMIATIVGFENTLAAKKILKQTPFRSAIYSIRRRLSPGLSAK